MGLTVLDAGVLIGFLDADDPHHAAASEALRSAIANAHALAVPASAYAELLVGPARTGTTAIERTDEFLARVPITVVPIDAAIARSAAMLRARHRGRLKLPDALVVATAIVLEAEALITTDRGWPSRRTLDIAAAVVTI